MAASTTTASAAGAVLEHGYEYDLVVVGGGSGGLACSREAVKFGKKVAVIDFVKPSTQKTVWGLGGTCVNVGCIPKKLMHTGALLGESLADAKQYGWSGIDEKPSHSWASMVDAIQDHIGSLNWGYRVALQDESVEYINALATLKDAHTIHTVNKAKKERTLTAKNIVIAVGGRPMIPSAEEVPGALEHAISSDDIFSLTRDPGRTLVVGASYVALECAGFLAGLGYDTTVMVRSILLRGFDQECAEMIGSYMSEHGVKFVRGTTPQAIRKTAEDRFEVDYRDAGSGQVVTDVYDTVLYAAGRTADTASLGLEAAGVTINKRNGKIPVTHEQSNVPNIYAIGDVMDGGLELTPVAIKAGRLLARRLFGGSTQQMDYLNVATAVFTPLEYGAVGLSEEAALAAYPDKIEVYHAFMKPLEHSVAHRPENIVFGKMLVHKETDRVVGIHYLGPNAGELIQGYSVAVKAGATKAMFDDTVGIHPTISEEFVDMHITKASGKDPRRTGC